MNVSDCAAKRTGMFILFMSILLPISLFAEKYNVAYNADVNYGTEYLIMFSNGTYTLNYVAGTPCTGVERLTESGQVVRAHGLRRYTLVGPRGRRNIKLGSGWATHYYRRRVYIYEDVTNVANTGYAGKSYYSCRNPVTNACDELRVGADGTYVLFDQKRTAVDCGRLERTKLKGVYKMISNEAGWNHSVRLEHRLQIAGVERPTLSWPLFEILPAQQDEKVSVLYP